MYRESDLAVLMRAWGFPLQNVDSDYHLTRNGTGTVLFLQPFSPHNDTAYEISATGVVAIPRPGEWVFRNDSGKAVAWKVGTRSGSEVRFATGGRRTLRPRESIDCEWSGQFCSISRFAWS